MNRNSGFALSCLIALLSCGLFGAYVWLYPMNHDVGFFLDVAGRVLRGERLYEDILTPNTPFIVWYSMLPVWLATEPWQAPDLFFACMMVMLALSILLCLCLWRRDPYYGKPLPLAFMAFLLPLVLVFFPSVNAGSDFGQREHIFMVLFFPYLLLCLLKLRGMEIPLDMRLVTAIFGLLGLLTKPHFIVLFAASELYLFWRSRNLKACFRTESIIMGAGWIAAHAAAIVLYPHYWDGFAEIVAAYSGYLIPLKEFIFIALGQCFIVLAIGGMIFWLVMRAHAAALVEIRFLFWMILVSFALYVIQRGPFLYHAYPMYALFWFTCGYVFLHIQEQKKGAYFTALALAGFVLPLKPLQAIEGLGELRAEYVDALKQRAVMRNRYSGKSFAYLGTSMVPTFPAVNYAGMYDVNANSLLLHIPVTYKEQQPENRKPDYHKPEKMDAVEKHFFERGVKDIVTRKPNVILVNINPHPQGIEQLDFDFIAYFSQDARFREAFHHYQKVASPYAHLDIYERTY